MANDSRNKCSNKTQQLTIYHLTTTTNQATRLFENFDHNYGLGLFHLCLIFSVIDIADPINVVCQNFNTLALKIYNVFALIITVNESLNDISYYLTTKYDRDEVIFVKFGLHSRFRTFSPLPYILCDQVNVAHSCYLPGFMCSCFK